MKMKSPAFSEFRAEMDRWDEASAVMKKREKIATLLGTNELVLFFKKNNEVYGSPEEGRLIFARIKNPEPGDEKWVDEATFSASNLSKAIKGEEVEQIFGSKDLKDIKIMDEDTALTELAKQTKNVDDIKTTTSIEPSDSPEAPDASPAMSKLGDDK